MGQIFNTPKGDQNQDLASSFTAFFKNFKLENKIISQERLSLISSHIRNGNIPEAISVIQNALKEIDNATLNIAVTGETGAGKSSFINALREVRHEEEDAAPTGVVETTMERTVYTHRNFPSVKIWDLPGIGGTNFRAKDYLEKVKFHEYDLFIIISATRFKENDIELAKAIKMMKKNFYFIRTKVDSDLQNEKKTKPTTFDREQVLQQIREYCVSTFQEHNFDEPQIFLVSNNNLSEFDFQIMTDTLRKDLPAQKRHCLLLSLPEVTEKIIETKRESLKQYIWLQAFKAAVLATLPKKIKMEGIFRDNDVENLKASLNHYRCLFGVDDASLQALAKNLQVPVKQLKKNIKSPKLLETRKEEKIGDKLLNYLDISSSGTGDLLAGGLYFTETYYLHFYFLDTVVEDAKVLFELTYSRNRVTPKAHTTADHDGT